MNHISNTDLNKEKSLYNGTEGSFRHAIKMKLKYLIGPENISTFRHHRDYLLWKLKGRPVPAHMGYKWLTLKRQAALHGIDIFIETGTAGGGTVRELEKHFKKLYTIELDPVLYREGLVRSAKTKKVEFLEGDSGTVLKELLAKIDSPALFWLDAHFSGEGTARGPLDTPIIQELQTIFSHNIKTHVIVIDDMREFNGTNDYPVLDELKKFIVSKAPGYKYTIDNDLMIIEPVSTN